LRRETKQKPQLRLRLRNQMFKMLIPLASKGQNWMYSYDARAA
jgi:hypothetical protein